MESILKADIFFLISTISVVIITAIILVAGIYFIKIIRNFYKISSILKKAAENAEADLKEISEHVRESPLFTFLFGKKKKKEVKTNFKKSI